MISRTQKIHSTRRTQPGTSSADNHNGARHGTRASAAGTSAANAQDSASSLEKKQAAGAEVFLLTASDPTPPATLAAFAAKAESLLPNYPLTDPALWTYSKPTLESWEGERWLEAQVLVNGKFCFCLFSPNFGPNNADGNSEPPYFYLMRKSSRDLEHLWEYLKDPIPFEDNGAPALPATNNVGTTGSAGVSPISVRAADFQSVLVPDTLTNDPAAVASLGLHNAGTFQGADAYLGQFPVDAAQSNFFPEMRSFAKDAKRYITAWVQLQGSGNIGSWTVDGQHATSAPSQFDLEKGITARARLAGKNYDSLEVSTLPMITTYADSQGRPTVSVFAFNWSMDDSVYDNTYLLFDHGKQRFTAKLEDFSEAGTTLKTL